MVDYTGTGGIWGEFTFSAEFSSRQSTYLKSKIKQPDINISKFQARIEQGISLFRNFEIWNAKAPDNDEIRKQIRKIKSKSGKLAHELFDLHANADSIIGQAYVINTKDHDDFDYPQNVSRDLFKLSEACDRALELTTTKKGPHVGGILHIPSSLKNAISSYALKDYSSISYSEGSFFVSYLDSVLEYLSLDDTFGNSGQIFDRVYKPVDTARTIAKSFKNWGTN